MAILNISGHAPQIVILLKITAIGVDISFFRVLRIVVVMSSSPEAMSLFSLLTTMATYVSSKNFTC